MYECSTVCEDKDWESIVLRYGLGSGDIDLEVVRIFALRFPAFSRISAVGRCRGICEFVEDLYKSEILSGRGKNFSKICLNKCYYKNFDYISQLVIFGFIVTRKILNIWFDSILRIL